MTDLRTHIEISGIIHVYNYHYTTMVNFHGYNNTCTNDNWSRPRMYMRGRGLSTLVVIPGIHFEVIKLEHRVLCSHCLSSWMGKVIFYRTFVSREPRKVSKVKNVRRNVGFP